MRFAKALGFVAMAFVACAHPHSDAVKVAVPSRSGPPVARVAPVTEEAFGTKVVDPYRWMEAPESPELAEWFRGQGEYATKMLGAIPERAEILARLREIAEGGRAVADVRRVGSRVFYTRLDPGASMPKVVVRENGAERVLVDPASMHGSAGHVSLEQFSVSPDASRLAYNLAEGGSEVSTLHVIDVGSGRELADAIPRVWGEFAASWEADGSGFYYTQMSEAGFRDRAIDRFENMHVYRHRLGDPAGADVAVYDANGPRIAADELPLVKPSLGSTWVLGLSVNAAPHRRVFIAQADAASRSGVGAWSTVAEHEDEVGDARVHGDWVYLLSTKGASNGKILRTRAAHPSAREAEVFVPEGTESIEAMRVARDGLYVVRVWNGRSRVHRVDFATGRATEVTMPFAGMVDDVATDPRSDGATLEVEDWTHPETYFEIVGDRVSPIGLASSFPIALDDLESEEVEARSSDGALVPLSIIRSKRYPKDHERPTILYGYGAYGSSVDPYFPPNAMPWIERGGIWAVAHVRGGGEKGNAWRLAGSQANKQNGIHDFIACAEHLIREGYTSAGHVAAFGVSMGGVLVGGAITERPDLFAAAAVQSGDFNVLRYEAMSNGANQRWELGDPKTEAGFRALLAMDPYQHIKDGVAYPALLLSTGLNDERVPPWATAKLGARMQAATSSKRPVLVRTDKDAGHGIGSTREQRYTLYADTWAFFWQQLGGAPSPTSAVPASRREDVVERIFGVDVHDPYRWLEDAKSPEVKGWTKAQDDYARDRLARSPERPAIASRLRELSYVDDEALPMIRAGRTFRWRRTGTQEKWVYYWSEKGGPEKVLLDPNTWSKDGSKSLREVAVSHDAKHVAYTVSENNADEATLHVLDIDSGRVSTIDVIPGAKEADVTWAPKSDAFYYMRLPVDPTIPTDERPGYREAYLHRLGTDPARDTLIEGRTGDPTAFLEVWIARGGRWLFKEIWHGWQRNEVWFRDLQSPKKEWTPLFVGVDAQASVGVYRDRMYALTNDGAPTRRLFAIDPKKPQRTAWQEIVPAREETLRSYRFAGKAILLEYLKDATSRVELHSLDGKLIRGIALPGLGSAALWSYQDEDTFFWSFESYGQPWEIHQSSVSKGGDTRIFETKLPVDPSAFVTEQVFFPSKDGTRIPMFIVHGKSFVRDGRAPAYVNGYGGFQVSLTPRFESSMVPWIERGGIAVVTNLRGGGEYGDAWHRAGMRHTKQNVFDDFEAAAEYLAREKYTRADRLVIEGDSNGGLLVGAALTQRPELYRAVICGVPLLDMIRYPRFGAGRTWIDEYGSAENPENFKALLAYSPYHHIKPNTPYPAVLIDSADSDDRVDPMHARKFAAALQSASTRGPVLLRAEHNAGHGGADLVRAHIERTADRLAFAWSHVAHD